jgi:hypothetical protein
VNTVSADVSFVTRARASPSVATSKMDGFFGEEKRKQRRKQRFFRLPRKKNPRYQERERMGGSHQKPHIGKIFGTAEKTIDRERARDAPVYVARTATARARLRRETLEGARKPVGRVVGWIRGKSRVSGIEREGGRAV